MSPAPTAATLKQIARRLARPVTSPIDGRVADINSRVDDTSRRVDRLETAVSTFAEAATESTSYVGMELSRLGGMLDSIESATQRLSEAGAAEYHQRWLADAVRQPLEQLGGDLASVLNYAAGHRGPAAQANLWFNAPVTVELGDGGARLSHVNERIVEVPFAMMALSRLPAGSSILDVGSAESTFPLSAASLGYQVTAVEPRGLPYSHPQLETVAARFEDLPAPDRPFDAVFLISTIEHVGLPAYGVTPHGEVTPGQGADRELLQRVRSELLAPDGFVVITTPYGERAVDDFERTYDDESLEALFDGWRITERRAARARDALTWEPLEPGAAAGDDGVVMLVATPE
jgi:hypothetical protein